MGEEMGELFKAIRKTENISTDANSETFYIGEELADILIYVCAIANRCGINLEEAFREKEEINKQRVWE
jgi:NTP pyrophosphatase (non-canonical NTP hydrolase)